MVNPFKVKDVKMTQVGGRNPEAVEDFSIRKNIDILEGTIQKVPVNNTDIANKLYVDNQVGGGGAVVNTINISGGNLISGALMLLSGSNIILTEHGQGIKIATTPYPVETSLKISGGNAISGAIMLLSGANITLVEAGNGIIISAASGGDTLNISGGTLISSATLASANSWFVNIPAGYRWLELYNNISAGPTGSSVNLTFNGVAGTSYNYRMMTGTAITTTNSAASIVFLPNPENNRGGGGKFIIGVDAIGTDGNHFVTGNGMYSTEQNSFIMGNFRNANVISGMTITASAGVMSGALLLLGVK